MANIIKLGNEYYNLDQLVKISEINGTCFSMIFSNGDYRSVCLRTNEDTIEFYNQILKKLGVN